MLKIHTIATSQGISSFSSCILGSNYVQTRSMDKIHGLKYENMLPQQVILKFIATAEGGPMFLNAIW